LIQLFVVFDLKLGTSGAFA